MTDERQYVCCLCPELDPFDNKYQSENHVRSVHPKTVTAIGGWTFIDAIRRPVDPDPVAGHIVLDFVSTLHSLGGADCFVAECEIADGRMARLL